MILTIEFLAVIFGYQYVSQFVVPSKRLWGIAVFFGITLLLPMLSTYIGPWPFGIPLLLAAYVAGGVGIKALYRPDPIDEGAKKSSDKFEA